MKTTEEFPKLVERLLTLTDNAEAVEAEELDWAIERPKGSECWPDELLSINGTEIAKTITPEQREELGFQELRNLFSQSQHGEIALNKAINTILETYPEGPVADYMKTIVVEEERHIKWFQGFCNAFSDGVLPNRLVEFPDKKDDPTIPMVNFCLAMLFEAILDHYNRLMTSDERMHPLTRQIHALHHGEESRHLAFDRGVILHFLEGLEESLSAEQMAAERKEISEFLEGFVELLHSVFCSKEVYEAAGLENPHEVRRQVMAAGIIKQQHDKALKKVLTFLNSIGLYPEVA